MDDPGLLPGLAQAMVLGFLGAVAVGLTRRHRTDLGLQLRLFGIAFFLRFALSVAIYQFGLVRIFGDEDASGWYAGVTLQQQWLEMRLTPFELPFEAAQVFEGRHRGYAYLLGLYFYLTNSPYRLVAAAINALCGALTVVLCYRIAASLFSTWVARRVGWWTCVFPSMLIWCSLTVKEPVVIFLETAALYFCVQLRLGGLSARHLLLCAVTVVALLPFRFYGSYVIALAAVATLIAPNVRRPRGIAAGAWLVALLVPLGLGTGALARHEAQFDRLRLDRVQTFRETVSTGGSTWGADSGVRTDDVRTPTGLLRGVTIGAAHLLLAPFPWQLGGGSLRMALTLPELLVWWWLVFAGVIPGLRYTLRHRFADVIGILLFLGAFGLLYSLMFGNVGLVFRQRAQLLPWLLILAAVGLEQRALRARIAAMMERRRRSERPAPPTPEPGQEPSAPLGQEPLARTL